MRGEADHHVGTDQLPHLPDRHVLLAHVYPVGARLQRHRGAVVDDQQRSQLYTDRASSVHNLCELAVAKALLAQLHDVHTAGDRRAQDIGQLTATGL